MSTKQSKAGRPAGAQNVRPSKAAVDSYYRLLTNAADTGDTQAAAALIQLDMNQRNQEQAK